MFYQMTATPDPAPAAPQPDPAEMLRALEIIAAPGQVVELRALDASTPAWRRPHTVSGYFDDPALLAAAAARLTGARGVYVTLNPANPALLARAANRLRDGSTGMQATADGEIAARRWLPVDADPVRPADVSASEAEHAAALATTGAIREALAGFGWPDPVVADSGNGGHLLYRVDLPADDGGLVERALAALAFLFDDDRVEVDRKVFNPARIWKLYGTVARKGDHTPDRPHRLARLLSVPETVEVVPRELLEALAALAAAVTAEPAAPAGQRSKNAAGPGRPRRPFDLAAWLLERGVPVSEPRDWGRDGRRWIFPVCPWNGAHRRSAYIVQFASGAIAAGCHHNSCRGRDWHALRDLYEPGWRGRRPSTRAGPASGPALPDPGGASPAGAAGATVPAGRAVVTDAGARAGPALAAVLAELSGLAPARDPAARAAIEARALELVDRCLGLDDPDLLLVASTLRALGCKQGFIGDWRRVILHKRRGEGEADDPAAIPYATEGGRTYRLVRTVSPAGEPQVQQVVIADFAVRIVEEARAEDGHAWFTLQGETAEGRPLWLEIPAEEFAGDRTLQAALTQAAGACAPVRANMAQHLRPAIQLLTNGDLARTRRFDRTGWVERTDLTGLPQTCQVSGQVFLIPGREPSGVTVRLARKLPYRIEPEADLGQGLDALEQILLALGPQQVTLVAAALFGAPLARPAGWGGERYAVFIAGRTGSLKTAVMQVLMCVYGAAFIRDEFLLKMGEGATRNAIMGYAAQAHDVPFVVDNYKPNTGEGARGFVNLVHNLLEGGERERMTRSAELRETRPVFCWPFFTGEDVPDGDAAGLARVLVVPFDWPGGRDNPALTRAQALAGHLPAVGGAWLAWLEAEAGRSVAAQAGGRFPELRSHWLDVLHSTRPNMVNPLRVASNLAINQLSWWALCRHPQIGALAARYEPEHAAGLAALAGDMARRTTQSLEATRFIEVLRELLVTERCVLLAWGPSPPAPRPAKGEGSRSSLPARSTLEGSSAGTPPERVLGWLCPDGSIYLVPELARREVERVLGPGGLNGIGSETLYAQLNQLGLIAGHDAGRMTRKIRAGKGTQNVLHLTGEAVDASGSG